MPYRQMQNRMARKGCMLSCGRLLPAGEIATGEKAVDGDGTWSLYVAAGDEPPRNALAVGVWIVCVGVPPRRVAIGWLCIGISDCSSVIAGTPVCSPIT